MTLLIKVTVWSENEIKLKHAELFNINGDVNFINVV
jgi:hypothetical protein